MASPYLRRGRSSGSPYLRRSSGGHHSSHSLLHDVVHNPATAVAGHLAGDVKDTIFGLYTGVPLVAKDLYRDTVHPLPGTTGNESFAHPLRALEHTRLFKDVEQPVGRGYADFYSHDFLHHLYQHPLGPILDALAVFTGGSSALAKSGKLLADAGAISDTSRLARLGDPGTIELRSPAAVAGERGAPVYAKSTSHVPFRRWQQELVDRALKSAHYEAPVIGELARFGRALRRDPAARESILRQQAAPYMAAYAKLNKKERRALAILGRVPLPAHLDAWQQELERSAARGNHDAALALKDITDPKVRALYETPSKTMLRAHHEASALGERAAQEMDRLGILDKAGAEAARFRHSLIAAGGRYEPGGGARVTAAVKRARKRVIRLQKNFDRLDTPRAVAKRLTRVQAEARVAEIDRTYNDIVDKIAGGYDATTAKAITAGRNVRNSRVDAARRAPTVKAEARAYAEAQLTKLLERNDHPSIQRLNAMLGEADQLRGRLETHQEALANGQRPLTHFGSDIQDIRGGPSRDRIGGALSVAKDELQALEKRAASRHPQVVDGPSIDDLRAQLQAAGRPEPIYLPDVARTPVKRVSRGGSSFGYGSPTHASDGLLFATGRLALEPDVLGPQYLRVVLYTHYRDLHDLLLNASVRAPAHEALPEGWTWLKQPAGGGDLEALIPDPAEIPDHFTNHGLTSPDGADALLDHGYRYRVPAALARRAESEFQRSNKVVRLFLERPTAVWRALVLNLRVAWLVNNIVGNHLLYAIRYAGPSGLRGYLDAISTSKGADAARQLLDLPETKRALTPSDLAELLPEQASGTFIGSQAPSGKLGRVARRTGLGLATADKAIEGGLRRAATNAELRRAPAVRARMRAMPKETRSFRTAAREELEANPQLARDVSEKVNAALGDFLSLTPGEKRYLRAVFPFYAWYKAITQIAAKLPLDLPIRTDIISKVDAIGAEQQKEQLGPLPSFLEGSISLGGDRILKTQGLNPVATVTQLGRAAAVPFVPGAQTNQLAGLANPFVQLLGAALFGQDQTKKGLLGDFGAGLTTDIPQLKLGRALIEGPQPSKLYQPSALDELYAYLGVPVRTYNRQRARELHAQGR